MSVFNYKGGVVFGIDLDAIEQQQVADAPLTKEARDWMAGAAVNLSHSGVAAIVEGVLIGALDQLVNKHKLDADEAAGSLTEALKEAIFQWGEEHEIKQTRALARRLDHNGPQGKGAKDIVTESVQGDPIAGGSPAPTDFKSKVEAAVESMLFLDELWSEGLVLPSGAYVRAYHKDPQHLGELIRSIVDLDFTEKD